MSEENAQNKDEIRRPGSTVSPVLINYVLIAIVFLFVGVFIAEYALVEETEPEAVQVDEAQLRRIIQSVLDESDFSQPIVEEGPGRFELVDDDPYLGEVDAPVVIVEFSDFFCSYCKRHFDMTFTPLLENYGQYIRYVYRDFARLTAESTPAAAAAQCAFEQGKFWEFHNDFFSNQQALGRDFYIETADKHGLELDRFIACLDDGAYVNEVEFDGLDGQLAGVRGTPGFFINGQILSGAQPYSIFERMVQRELDKAGIEFAVAAAGDGS